MHECVVFCTQRCLQYNVIYTVAVPDTYYYSCVLIKGNNFIVDDNTDSFINLFYLIRSET